MNSGVSIMGKIRFMAEEFFRSFRKNLFKDLLLMVIFSICFLMVVLLGSYYLDLGERDSDSAQYYEENGIWYKAGLEFFNDENEVLSNLDTISGCRKVMSYYEKVRNMENHPLMSVMTAQTMLMKESVVTEKFGDKNYKRFVNDNRDSFMAYFGDEGCSVLEMRSAQLDFRAYGLYGLKTEEGEGFTAANTTLKYGSDAIPVILGNEYKGIFSVGDRIDICMAGTEYVYPCRVAGILEAETQIPEYGYYTQDMVLLDNYIIFPYGIFVQESARTKLEEIKKYAFLDIVALENSSVQVGDEKEFNELVLSYRDMGIESDLPPIRLYEAPMGLDLLRKESAFSVRVMLILTITLSGFVFYSLFVAFYDKIQSGKRTYGVYLMNGCSVGMILLPCILETAVILLPALLVCRWVFTNVGMDTNIQAIMRVGYCVVGISFLLSSVFLVFLMKGVNTEHLIRQKDS